MDKMTIKTLMTTSEKSRNVQAFVLILVSELQLSIDTISKSLEGLQENYTALSTKGNVLL